MFWNKKYCKYSILQFKTEKSFTSEYTGVGSIMFKRLVLFSQKMLLPVAPIVLSVFQDGESHFLKRKNQF